MCCDKTKLCANDIENVIGLIVNTIVDGLYEHL